MTSDCKDDGKKGNPMNNKIEEIQKQIDGWLVTCELRPLPTGEIVKISGPINAVHALITLLQPTAQAAPRLCSCPDHAAKPTKGRDFYFCANCGYRTLYMGPAPIDARGFGARGDVDVQKSPNVGFSREAWDDLVLAVRQASNTLFNLKQIGLTRAIIPSEASSMERLQEKLDKLLREMRQ